MASQPANTTINVLRVVRSYRYDGLHTSVKHRTTPFAPAIMSVPGEEILVTEYRNAANASDAFRYGHPVTVLPRGVELLGYAVGAVAQLNAVYGGMQFPIRLPANPRDVFLTKDAAHATEDLHAQLRAVSPAPNPAVTGGNFCCDSTCTTNCPPLGL